jgi:hypothetical protein
MWYLFAAAILAIEIAYSPRLGFTRGNNILLWYGKKERKYIVLL